MVRDNHMACEESLISVSVYGDTLNAKRHLKINSLKQLVCLNTNWTWSTASQVLIFKTVKNAFTLFSLLLTWAMRWIYFAITVFSALPDLFHILALLCAFAFSLIPYLGICVSVSSIDLWTWISIYLCKVWTDGEERSLCRWCFLFRSFQQV